MARPLPIVDLDPEGATITAARRIIPLRLDELHAFAPAVADPAAVQSHHDMRIAAKRLRYTMEIFRPCFPPAFAELIRKVRRIQDTLGLVHDLDVFGIFFARYLDHRRAEAEAELGRVLFPAGDGRSRQGGIADVRHVLDSTGGADERQAILELMARTRARRRETFAEFQRYWATLVAKGFRPTLLALIGDAAPATDPHHRRPGHGAQ